LIAYAKAICGAPDEADDLVQDAIVRALAADNVPVERDDLRPWMFRVIRNLHLDRCRKAKVRTEYSIQQKRLLGETPTAGGDPLSSLLVRQAFQSLTPEHREVLFLVDILGMRYVEAANVLAVPQGTVMSRLSRARRSMLDRMEGGNITPIHGHGRQGARQ
jgi:RNA polymerase sigma-70 factor (ECF subfamily)